MGPTCHHEAGRQKEISPCKEDIVTTEAKIEVVWSQPKKANQHQKLDNQGTDCPLELPKEV